MSDRNASVITDRTPQRDTLAMTVAPGNPAQVADALATFAAEGRAVVPVGGGGALQLGNPTSDAVVGISFSGLGRVIDYQSTDMTLSVEAGATLAEIANVLGEKGQQLPIEAPAPQTATIGGLLATALTGPRRYGGGSLRDVIIGVSVAYPDGTTGKAGGMVVKNVSGFDLMRVHLGALGTLGVITSANFKVLPVPRSEFTLSQPLADLAEVDRVVRLLRAPSVRPVALVVDRSDGGWQLSARFEGRASGLASVATALRDLFGTVDRIDDQNSARHWQSFVDRRAFGNPAEVRVQLRGLPTTAVSTADALLGLAVDRVDFARFEIEPGLGVLTLSWDAGPAETTVDVIKLMRSLGQTTAVVVQTAPDEVKRRVDVWGDPPESIELMRRLKLEFDPGRLINPGRYAGMI